MAITFEQAMTAERFHVAGQCHASVGPRGGVYLHDYEWRRNGHTRTYKRWPGEFQLPLKYGLRSYDRATHRDMERLYVAEECPVCSLVRKYYNEPEVLREKLLALNADVPVGRAAGEE